MPDDTRPVSDETEELPPPAFRFFSPGQVTLAAAIGGFIAGALLMALNYWRLGRPAAVGKTVLGVLAGIVCAAAVGAAGAALPDTKVVSIGFIVVSVTAMNVLSTRFQGQACREHLERGGRRAAGSAVIGISIVCLCVVLAIVALCLHVLEPSSGVECE